jgi:hypothetical protein
MAFVLTVAARLQTTPAVLCALKGLSKKLLRAHKLTKGIDSKLKALVLCFHFHCVQTGFGILMPFEGEENK